VCIYCTHAHSYTDTDTDTDTDTPVPKKEEQRAHVHVQARASLTPYPLAGQNHVWQLDGGQTGEHWASSLRSRLLLWSFFFVVIFFYFYTRPLSLIYQVFLQEKYKTEKEQPCAQDMPNVQKNFYKKKIRKKQGAT
jgi:hypothetical protein